MDTDSRGAHNVLLLELNERDRVCSEPPANIYRRAFSAIVELEQNAFEAQQDLRGAGAEMDEAWMALVKGIEPEDSEEPLLLLADRAAQRIAQLEFEVAELKAWKAQRLTPPAPVVPKKAAPAWGSRIREFGGS